MQRFFTPSHRQLGRLESKARAPIFSHYSETLNGVAVIRAFKLQKRFEEESNRRVDKYQECQFLVCTVNK
ncbi:MAG: ABC transporter transmembrane domain-containing protein [Candidatus Thiodiazotropha sp.]